EVGVEVPAVAHGREEGRELDLAGDVVETLGLVARCRAQAPAALSIAGDAHAHGRRGRRLVVVAAIDLEEDREPIDGRAPDATAAGELRGVVAALAAVHAREPRDARGEPRRAEGGERIADDRHAVEDV